MTYTTAARGGLTGALRRSWMTLMFGLVTAGCEDRAAISAEHAARHVENLATTAASDVAEIRSGLPSGASHLGDLWKDGKAPEQDLAAVREGLLKARDKVQDLRVAKSTFFALVAPDGLVLRNDQEQDRMAGKNLLGAYPALKKALDGAYTETIGSMKEAAGIAEPRKDAQWVAAAPVKADSGVVGLYVTGFSFTSYAYRLEFKLRGEIRAELAKVEHSTQNEPLVYAFVLVGSDVYGAPAAPDVNLETVGKLGLVEKSKAGTHKETLRITGRDFGVAAKRVPEFGTDVAIAVLRSET